MSKILTNSSNFIALNQDIPNLSDIRIDNFSIFEKITRKSIVRDELFSKTPNHIQ